MDQVPKKKVIKLGNIATTLEEVFNACLKGDTNLSKLETTLINLVPERYRDEAHVSCWFRFDCNNLDQTTVGQWHYERDYAMVCTAWPSPTQFKIDDKIITPPLGDVFYIPKYVLHRGQACPQRLLGRLWFERNWYENSTERN